MGASGTADAFITGSRGQGSAARTTRACCVTIARASTNTTTLDGGRNYHAFHLDLPAKRGNACDGCASPAGIAWSTASLYGTQGATTVVSGAGLRSNIVSINGGTIDTGPTVSIADTRVVEGRIRNPGGDVHGEPLEPRGRSRDGGLPDLGRHRDARRSGLLGDPRHPDDPGTRHPRRS